MKVHSIFQSVNGEVTNSVQGSICTFLRLQGCRLQCKFCDTKDSQDPSKGTEMSPREISNLIYRQSIPTKNITITGGEPLQQREELLTLCSLLLPIYKITLETNGAMYIAGDIQALTDSIVMDIKPISADIQTVDYYRFYIREANEYACHLTCKDWIKYPVTTEEDFVNALRSKAWIKHNCHKEPPRFALSAVLPLTPKQLFDWIIERKVGDVILNVQIHKLLNIA